MPGYLLVRSGRGLRAAEERLNLLQRHLAILVGVDVLEDARMYVLDLPEGQSAVAIRIRDREHDPQHAAVTPAAATTHNDGPHPPSSEERRHGKESARPVA